MPCYNSSKYISDAIESILRQDYQNWELLIADDCSTDNSADIIKHYSVMDSRVKYFKLEKNSGAAMARNYCIERATGRYIAFCDSDDWWYPEKLSVQIGFMQKNGYEFICSNYEVTDENLIPMKVFIQKKRISIRTITMGYSIGTSSIVFDTKRIGKMYMPIIKAAEDAGLWIKIMRETGNAYSINKVLHKYRKCPASLSSDKLSMMRSELKMYKIIMGWSELRSIIFFFAVFMPNYFFRKVMSVSMKKDN